MVSEDIERIELKINLLLKAFLSFYGDDDYTYQWDLPFDDMKNEISNELIQLLDLDEKDEVRKAFIESFAMIPYASRRGGREWWSSGMQAIMSKASTRIHVLEAIAASRGRHVFPKGLRPQFKRLLGSGEAREIMALLGLYGKGFGFGEEPLLDKDDWIALSKDNNEEIRIAAVNALSQRIQDSDYVGRDVVINILAFSNDSSDKVMVPLVALLSKLSKTYSDDIDLKPLLTHGNDEVRYRAVAMHLGYDLDRKRWSSPRHRPDLKEVAKLVSDSYGPISKLAEEYLDRAQSSRR